MPPRSKRRSAPSCTGRFRGHSRSRSANGEEDLPANLTDPHPTQQTFPPPSPRAPSPFSRPPLLLLLLLLLFVYLPVLDPHLLFARLLAVELPDAIPPRRHCEHSP